MIARPYITHRRHARHKRLRNALDAPPLRTFQQNMGTFDIPSVGFSSSNKPFQISPFCLTQHYRFHGYILLAASIALFFYNLTDLTTSGQSSLLLERTKTND